MTGLTGKAKLAGVFGWPVSHSKSPRLHGFWLKQLGIDGAYVPLAVAPENFEAALRALPIMGFQGANVTVPHKEQALKLVDDLDPLARRIGAVNTLIVQENGRILGRNTDAFGFMANLRQGAPDWDASLPAMVIGAGGAARAVVAALVDEGVPEIWVINRSQERAEILAQDVGGPVRVAGFDRVAKVLGQTGLVVNTTSLGMVGQPPLELDLHNLSPKAVVNDIVYAPLMTDLLVNAKARGNSIVDGIGMLLWQAVPGFEAWFGQRPEVTPELRDFVLKS